MDSSPPIHPKLGSIGDAIRAVAGFMGEVTPSEVMNVGGKDISGRGFVGLMHSFLWDFSSLSTF